MPTAAAERRTAEIEAALPDVRFPWNGRVDGSHTIYYRTQGPNLIIEFSTEESVGASGGSTDEEGDGRYRSARA